MGGSASGSMGHMGNMGSLAACSVTDSKPMQFPLAQRRKRRVLFTQAQVCPKNCSFFFFMCSLFYALYVSRIRSNNTTTTYYNPFGPVAIFIWLLLLLLILSYIRTRKKNRIPATQRNETRIKRIWISEKIPFSSCVWSVKGNIYFTLRILSFSLGLLFQCAVCTALFAFVLCFVLGIYLFGLIYSTKIITSWVSWLFIDFTNLLLK